MKTLALWKTKNKHWWNKLDFFLPLLRRSWFSGNIPYFLRELIFGGTHFPPNHDCGRKRTSSPIFPYSFPMISTTISLRFPMKPFPAGISWKGRRHWKQWCGRRLWRLATPKPFMTGQYKLGHETSNSRWFNVTFLSPSWRSRNLQKGHLTIPKRSQWIARFLSFLVVKTSINNGIIIILISLVATHICFIFHPIPEEMIQFDHIICFKWVETTK